MIQSLFTLCIMYVQYIGGCSLQWGCSVHRGDTISTSGGYHEYIGDTMSTLGDVMSTLGDVMSTLGGCLVHQGDIMMHVGEQVGKNFSISIENPDVLNIPQCTHGIPHMHHDIPDVLNIP